MLGAWHLRTPLKICLFPALEWCEAVCSREIGRLVGGRTEGEGPRMRMREQETGGNMSHARRKTYSLNIGHQRNVLNHLWKYETSRASTKHYDFLSRSARRWGTAVLGNCYWVVDLKDP